MGARRVKAEDCMSRISTIRSSDDLDVLVEDDGGNEDDGPPEDDVPIPHQCSDSAFLPISYEEIIIAQLGATLATRAVSPLHSPRYPSSRTIARIRSIILVWTG